MKFFVFYLMTFLLFTALNKSVVYIFVVISLESDYVQVRLCRATFIETHRVVILNDWKCASACKTCNGSSPDWKPVSTQSR